MPKGKHKGGKRSFTNFDELHLQEQKLKEQKKKEWRKARGDDSDSDEDKEKKEGDSEESSSSSSEEEEDEVKPKPKGISNLIEIENPNYVTTKMKKLSTLSATDTTPAASGQPTLSRKEREELEKERAASHYRKLHAKGKTDEAKADLERLAVIRKQREETQKRKEEEKKAKDAAAALKKEQVAKALNKKSTR